MKTLYGNDSKTLLLRVNVTSLKPEHVQEITDYLLEGGNVIFLSGDTYWTVIKAFKNGFTARSAGGAETSVFTDGTKEEKPKVSPFNVTKNSRYDYTLPRNNGVIYIKRLSTIGDHGISLMIPYDNYSETGTLIAFGYGGEYVEIEKTKGSNDITIVNNNNVAISVQVVL